MKWILSVGLSLVFVNGSWADFIFERCDQPCTEEVEVPCQEIISLQGVDCDFPPTGHATSFLPATFLPNNFGFGNSFVNDYGYGGFPGFGFPGFGLGFPGLGINNVIIHKSKHKHDHNSHHNSSHHNSSHHDSSFILSMSSLLPPAALFNTSPSIINEMIPLINSTEIPFIPEPNSLILFIIGSVAILIYVCKKG